MQTATRDRILEALEQSNRPVAIETLAEWTNLPQKDLEGFMDDLATNGGVQRIGESHYRYTGTPVPKEGENFTGHVTGTSFKGGVIVRDQTGTSWRIEPV